MCFYKYFMCISNCIYVIMCVYVLSGHECICICVCVCLYVCSGQREESLYQFLILSNEQQ